MALCLLQNAATQALIAQVLEAQKRAQQARAEEAKPKAEQAPKGKAPVRVEWRDGGGQTRLVGGHLVKPDDGDAPPSDPLGVGGFG